MSSKNREKAHQCSMEKKLFKVDFTEVTDDQINLICQSIGLTRDFFEIYRNMDIEVLYMDYEGATYAYEMKKGDEIHMTGVLSQLEEFTIPEEESLLFHASEEEIDRILAKVHMWGEDTLTPIQRKKLDRASLQKPLTPSNERYKVLPEIFRIDLRNMIQPDIKRLSQLLGGMDFLDEIFNDIKKSNFSDIWMDRTGNVWAAREFDTVSKWHPLLDAEDFDPSKVSARKKETCDAPTQEEIDSILDKICLSGVESLSPREMRRLRFFALKCDE